ncbi:MAG: hypothetical protein Q9160_002468 [Pyrenula sp. 1 TL-2023]
MNPYETFGSPTEAERPTSRYGRDDEYPPRNDSYRRRSPVGGRPRRQRDRSNSPPGIDRYQPQDRDRNRGGRDDHYENRHHGQRDREDRRRAPSPTAANIDRYVPGQNNGKPVVRTNPLPNPLNLDMQVGFTWFAEWWRMEQQIKEEKDRSKHGGRRPSDRVKGEKEAREDRERERAQIQSAYDQYKLDLQVRMARNFVQQHKDEEWFKEKYVPDIRLPIRERLTQFRQGSFEQWITDLDAGSFDEFTLEGIYKNEHDGAGGVVEKEEGEATGGAEVMGVLDLVPAKGGHLQDESLQQPALLIKTLAPNVSREKVEAFCKEHLGDEDGGFNWLSLSDPNPAKKCHRIGWIMLRPGESAEPMEDIQRGDGRDEEEEGETDVKVLTNGNAAKSTSERALESVNEKVITDSVRGDFTCHVGVHNPPSTLRKKALWDLFSAPERIERDLELAKRLTGKLEAEFGHEISGLAKIEERIENLRARGMFQPTNPSPVKAKKNAFVDNDDEIKFDEPEEGEEEGVEDEEDDEELIAVKKYLDIVVEYLRRVFNFCFFCVFESDSVHELVRKCPGGHLRRPRAGLNSNAKAAAQASARGEQFPLRKKKTEELEDGEEPPSPVEERNPRRFQSKTDQQLLRAFNWVKTFEDKIFQILEPEHVDLKKLGGRPLEEALEEDLKKFVKQEDEAKYRCKIPECAKLFKAEHFWRKHVEKRHEEWFKALADDLNLVNSYVLDPAHIAPSRSDANSNGHFPVPNQHMQTGTPRHFNLSNMNFGFNNMMNANPMAGGFQQPFVAQNANQNAFLSNALQVGMDGAPGMHHPGVMRRGGNRMNNTRPGPYDRRGNNPRNFNNRSGSTGGFGMGVPMTVPGGGPVGMGYLAQGGGGGGGKWGDGAAGGMAMGPREAVQGRSIKSYEDLDAQPAAAATGGATNAGGGELDY